MSEVLSLSSVEDALARLAFEWIELARTNLDASQRVSTGNLSDSIVASKVQVFGKTYLVEIKLNSYYQFVDKGVKGWKEANKAPNSPYQFKRTPAGQKMMLAIRDWMLREGLKGRARENSSRQASLRDQRRASMRDATTSAAYAMANKIKQVGTSPSYFWTNTADEMRKRIRQELGKALKTNIIEIVTK
jgi:hypothetical protein